MRRVAMQDFYNFFTCTGFIFTPFISAVSYYPFCIFCVFPARRKSMDWIYLLLTLAFFGLSVLLIRGIEKLGRPS